MSDFDMDAFDSIDFDSVEQSVAEKQAEKDKQESQEIEGMRDLLKGKPARYPRKKRHQAPAL